MFGQAWRMEWNGREVAIPLVCPRLMNEVLLTLCIVIYVGPWAKLRKVEIHV